MHAGMSGAHVNGVMASAQKKRYLDDVNEDDDEDEHGDDIGNRYGSIRLIPKMAQLESANTPGRKIAQLPKRMSMIASTPPRFDLDAPPLPSFATVANQALQRDIVNALQGDDASTSNNNEEGASSNTVTMQDDNVRASSETLEQDAPLHRIQQQQQQQQQKQAEQQQPFVFGSPRQQPVTDDTFLKRIDGFAIAKQLEELQRRTGTTGIAMGNGTVRKDWMPRTTSSGNLQANKGGNVRFEDKHQKEFKM